MPPKVSPWWPDGNAMDKIDKLCSMPIFRLQIGHLEWPLSVACLFGMPPSLLVGPLALALIHGGGERTVLATVALLVATCPVAWIWFKFCKGQRQAQVRLFSLQPLVGAPPLGLLIARIAGERAFAIGAFHTVAWFISMMPIIVLKAKCARRRPILENLSPSPRKIPAITRVLQPDGHKSFPSGDTAGAVAFAVPLAIACNMPMVGAFCVFWCGFARMYWKAHFVLDLAAGAAIGLVVSLLLHSTICPVGAVQWWQPLTAQALMIGEAMLLRRLRM